jgi:hypothetical protein
VEWAMNRKGKNMNLLLDSQNTILEIGKQFQFGQLDMSEPNIKKWKIAEHLFVLDNNYICKEVDVIPPEIEPYKYCYTEQDGFYLNPNWREQHKPTEQIVSELQQENEQLKAKLELLISKLNIEL